MTRYTFLTIQNDDVIEVPGEIIETYTNRPHSSPQFAALVKLSEESNPVPDEDSEEDSSVAIVWEDIDGVGNSTGKNLIVEGYETEESIRNASVEELSDVDGVGESTANNIIEYVG